MLFSNNEKKNKRIGNNELVHIYIYLTPQKFHRRNSSSVHSRAWCFLIIKN